MREKRILYGILALAVFFLLANPVMVNATSNDQRISGTGDPGSCTYIEPAVDGNDDLAAAVYIKHDTNGGSYKLKMKISTDDGETWSQNPININPTQSQKQRYPDVAVSKIQADGIIKDVIFVTWQEWKIDSWWEIWVCNFTYYNGNLSYQGRMRVSEHNGPYTEALFPRISVDYIPEVNHDGDYIDYSATFGIIVFQQERGDPSHPSLFKIMYTDFIHDTTDLNGQGNGHPMIAPHVWPLPMEIPGQTNQEFDNRYPSTDIDAYTREPYTSWSQPCCEIDIVFDNKYDDLAFQCIRLGGYVEGGKDNPCLNWTYGGSYNDTFNIGSSTWGYPDCAVRWEGSYNCNYHEAVVWQDDNNIPKTLSFKPSVTSEISLGICRTPQIKGISIDMTEPQYYPGAQVPIQWINPGGIKIIWRSGVINPETGNTYGIDAQIMEFKGYNNTFRVCQDYHSVGDDSVPRINYSPANVYHEPPDSRDTYLDISSISNGESHVTRERGSSVWYLTNDVYW